MKVLTLAFVALFAPVAVFAKPSPTPPPTVSSVDLHKYQGRWFEIARLPAWFQKECARSTATYTLQADGTLGVKNECRTHAGKEKAATATARVTDEKTNSRLVVTINNWAGKLGMAKGDYWIFYIGPGYQTAVVGTPNRKYLWFLARQPKISKATYGTLVHRAEILGFDPSKMIQDQW
jgi:apolipoprotein D and lipocalin family protein